LSENGRKKKRKRWGKLNRADMSQYGWAVLCRGMAGDTGKKKKKHKCNDVAINESLSKRRGMQPGRGGSED